MVSSRLKVVKDLKRTNQIVRTKKLRHLIGLEAILVDIYSGRCHSRAQY
jgi:hypothetical protein